MIVLLVINYLFLLTNCEEIKLKFSKENRTLAFMFEIILWFSKETFKNHELI